MSDHIFGHVLEFPENDFGLYAKLGKQDLEKFGNFLHGGICFCSYFSSYKFASCLLLNTYIIRKQICRISIKPVIRS